MRRGASVVREGDVCEVDFEVLDRSHMPSQQRRIVIDVLRQGHGKVDVESVTGANAYVTSHGNPMSKIVGGVNVPVEALSVARTASFRVAVVASRVVANEVQDTMIDQVRHFLSPLARAFEKALSPMDAEQSHEFHVYPPISKQGLDSILVKFRCRMDEGTVAGFTLTYNYGSDTYDIMPFVQIYGEGIKWGRKSTDFYVEDLGDVSRLEWIFKTAV